MRTRNLVIILYRVILSRDKSAGILRIFSKKLATNSIFVSKVVNKLYCSPFANEAIRKPDEEQAENRSEARRKKGREEEEK